MATTETVGSVDPRTQLIAAGALAVTSFLWGSMVPVTAIALNGYDAYLLSAVRYSIGTALLLAFLLASPRRLPPFHALPWRGILACGTAAATFVTLVTVALLFSDPITISATFAVAPLIAVLMDRVATRGGLSQPVIIGIVSAVGGGILVALGQGGNVRPRGGEIMVLVALAVWTWYSMKTQKWLAPAGLNQLQISALTLAWGSTVLWVVWGAVLAVGGIEIPSSIPPLKASSAMVWLALGPTSIALVLWNYGNAKVGVTIATLMINLTPVFSVLISIGIGYQPTLLQIVGGAIVLTGIGWMQIALMRRSAPAR